MRREELEEHLRCGKSFVCELAAPTPSSRRFAYIQHAADELQEGDARSENRLLFVAAFELPTELLEAKARGEIRDQADCRERIDHCTAHCASEAVAAIQQIVGDQKVIQPLQDEYEFNPPVLV
ncbi:MAG: hypothetical protein AAFZ38_00895 [Myxococcota bacterium]